METSSPAERPPSTTELIERARLTLLRPSEPETATEPIRPVHTIEDYIDSMEEVKKAKRYLAKVYKTYEIENMGENNLTETQQRQMISRNRPHWEEHFPRDDSPQEQARWDQFVSSFNDNSVQYNLRHLYRVTKKHHEISSDPAIAAEKQRHSHERLETMSHAAAYRNFELQEIRAVEELKSLRAEAKALGESSYPDQQRLQALESFIAGLRQARETFLVSEAVVDEIERRRNLDSKRQFEKGILMTDQMMDVERQNIGALLAGQPVLLIGETGGAKTALARHMAGEILKITGKPEMSPEVISGFAEINTYQLMGKNEIRIGSENTAENQTLVDFIKRLEDKGVTDMTKISREEKDAIWLQIMFGSLTNSIGARSGSETKFVPGPLVRAMMEGRPVILDEVNAMPAEILKRLNIIMQLRPGDKYSIQENNGMEVTVQPGFCIIATMNEKSHRYRGVEALSSEFRDRFGVNVAQISYPDQEVPPGSETIPPTLLRLAMLVCTDPIDGEVKLKNMSLQQLVSLVRATHFTEYMYTHLASDPSMINYATSERTADAGTNGLSKSVISPRTMVQIIEKVETGLDNLTLAEVMKKFLERLDDSTDKQIIQRILEDYNLIGTPEQQQA